MGSDKRGMTMVRSLLTASDRTSGVRETPRVNLKNKIDCGYDEEACTAHGMPASNGVWVKGSCICRRCLNGQNKKLGTRAQRTVASQLGLYGGGLGAGSETGVTRGGSR